MYLILPSFFLTDYLSTQFWGRSLHQLHWFTFATSFSKASVVRHWLYLHHLFQSIYSILSIIWSCVLKWQHQAPYLSYICMESKILLTVAITQVVWVWVVELDQQPYFVLVVNKFVVRADFKVLKVLMQS